MPRGKKREKVNKVQLVEEALGHLGKDAKPLEIQKDVKAKHGIELDTSLISTYKGYIAGKKKGNGRKKGRKPAEAGNAKADGITVHDIEAVKALVDRMGAEKVRELAKVLGK